MRVVSNKTLLAFSAMHPQAAKPVQLWRKAVEARSYPNVAGLKSMFGSIDKANGCHVFEIDGTKYRVVAAVHFAPQMLFVRHVFTHRQYERWSAS